MYTQARKDTRNLRRTKRRAWAKEHGVSVATQAEKEGQKRYRLKMRTWATEHGMCTYCYKVSADSGYITCQKCREKGRLNNVKHKYDYRDRRDRYNKRRKEWLQEMRHQVLEHYGGKCACCGETEPIFLCIDHINGDGAEHRRKESLATNIYRWLVKYNFPDGFQVLCWNCNAAKFYQGVCPHQTTHLNFSPLRLQTTANR